MLQLLLTLTLTLLQAAAATKWYSGGPGFDRAAAWRDDYVPCARDTVMFPADFPAVLPLPADLNVAGFVLPRQGALLLNQDATITLNDWQHRPEACSTPERRAYLKAPRISKWFDPRSWHDTDKLGSTAAVPEMERVPCNAEHVIITNTSGAISFDVEHVQYLRLGQLSLAGSSISKAYLQTLLATDLGQLLFHNAAETRVEYYRSDACGCHKDFEHFVESVCHNVAELCPRPHCVSPVRPYGACCDVCGAVLMLPVNYCAEPNRKALVSYVNEAVAREDLADELLTHIDFVSSAHYGNFLQTIVVDRHPYNERSVQFMRRLMQSRNNSKLLAAQTELQVKYAGRPYNPYVSFASVLLIICCIVLVAVVALIMLAHFMPQNRYLNRIPQWIHDPRRWRWSNLNFGLRSNLLFARFDNAVGVVTATSGSGVEQVAAGIIGYNAGNEELSERAFNNPMFEQSIAVQSQLQTQTEPQQLAKMEVGELDSCSVEEQELTEINLESSEAESDGEAETVR